MDLEKKAYIRVDKEALWDVLKIQVYDVGEKLLEAVKSFYVESKPCVRVGRVVHGTLYFTCRLATRMSNVRGCLIYSWMEW